MTFLDFVLERHNIWKRRQTGQPQPWTDNPILATRKFTNVFRWLDPGSQFVITDLLEDGLPPEEFLMRCFLYRHTNLPDAWRAYRNDTGSYPTGDDLGDLQEFWKGYRDEGGRVFSGAYMIYPQSAVPGTDKIESIIDLTRRLFVSSKRLTHDFFKTNSQVERFMALKTNKGVADFMSMQILTDFGYSTEFREDEFVVLGPGAKRGAEALLNGQKGDLSAVHKQMLGLILIEWETPEAMGRRLSAMDVQNCLCEFSKYVRYAASDKPSPEKPYSPAHPGVQSTPVVPPNWQHDLI